jgi:hypothetical protein
MNIDMVGIKKRDGSVEKGNEYEMTIIVTLSLPEALNLLSKGMSGFTPETQYEFVWDSEQHAFVPKHITWDEYMKWIKKG